MEVVPAEPAPTSDAFEVELAVFQGPFDLLLQLISRRQLDITEIALSEVTDEFLAHMRRFPDLAQASEFLVVAATLLEMKAAGLLPRPAGEESAVDEELSARDLLFSKLLQYRAFRLAAASLGEQLASSAMAYPRSVPLEPHLAALLPKLLWRAGAADLRDAAQAALADPPRPDEAEHVAQASTTLDHELAVIRSRLAAAGRAQFVDLVESASGTAVVVTRFLAVLQLYRQGDVSFEQAEPLGPLTIVWCPAGEPREGSLAETGAGRLAEVRDE